MFKTTFLDDGGKVFEIGINPDDSGYTQQIGFTDGNGVVRMSEAANRGYTRTARTFKTGTYSAVKGVGGVQANKSHVSKLCYDAIVGASGTADLKTTLS